MPSINKVRSILYTIARVLGDIQAVRTGRIGQRILRRGAGRITNKGLNKLFK
ncbi:hypothetical protein [Planococcus dechangensis]|uniref:Uncharacterized protein n=1 Tax=Planococcus dechangensis TaxID=1176255 RepID=A0ABV9MAZ8_9BACL